jgi:O-antigen ligase
LPYGAIIVLLIATPWPFGSRLPWAAMLGATLVLSTGAVWFAYRMWAGPPIATTPLHGVIMLFLVWIGMQWLFGWTVYQHGTAYDGVLLLSYATVFAVCVDLARDRDVAYRLHLTIIAAGLAVGIFALLQFLTWNGRLFWLFEPPYGGTAFGPFNNRNYFAGYMLVVLSVAVAALLAHGLRRGRGWFLYLTWLAVLALLLCLSRGGFIGFAVATVAALMLRSRSPFGPDAGGRRAARDGLRPGGRWRSAIPSRYLALAGVVALLAGLLLLRQTDRVFARLETLLRFQNEGSFIGRTEFWRDALSMIGDRPITGFGLGSYVWMFPSYRQITRSVVETNAHNEYIEMAAETGLVGAAICLAFLLLFFRHGMLRLRNAVDAEELGIRLGAVCAWIGICVYAISDFPTVIPAIDYVLAVLAALAVAAIGPSSGPARRRHRTRIEQGERHGPGGGDA